MVVLLLGLLAFEMPADTNVMGGFDALTHQFSRYWDWIYETSPHGLRTSQGCSDIMGWYTHYQAKTEANFSQRFKVRYRFHMLQDYGIDLLEHRFEPTVQIFENLYFLMLLSPYFQKRNDELGLGLGWRRDNLSWLDVSVSIKGFDHNFSLGETPPGPTRDPFGKIPFKFEVDGRWETDWLRLRICSQLQTRGNQYLDWPDSTQYVWNKDFDQSLAWGRLELKPFNHLWVGSRFSWDQGRSLTRWPGQEIVTYDTLVNMSIEPFLSFSPSKRLNFHAQYLFWGINREMDSVTYHSRVDVCSFISSWHPISWLVVSAGYQRSFKQRWNNDTLINEPYRHEPGSRQNRLIFNLEIRAKSGLMLSIKEGIELDQAPVRTFRNYHNHTYILLHMPLGWLMSKDSKHQSERLGNRK